MAPVTRQPASPPRRRVQGLTSELRRHRTPVAILPIPVPPFLLLLAAPGRLPLAWGLDRRARRSAGIASASAKSGVSEDPKSQPELAGLAVSHPATGFDGLVRVMPGDAVAPGIHEAGHVP